MADFVGVGITTTQQVAGGGGATWAPQRKTYLEAVRREEAVSVDTAVERNKHISIVFSFDGKMEGWTRLVDHVEMARSWVVACGQVQGRTVMKVEEENLRMEVEVIDPDSSHLFPAMREVCRRSIEEDEGGRLFLARTDAAEFRGQPVSPVQISNCRVPSEAVVAPRTVPVFGFGQEGRPDFDVGLESIGSNRGVARVQLELAGL